MAPLFLVFGRKKKPKTKKRHKNQKEAGHFSPSDCSSKKIGSMPMSMPEKKVIELMKAQNLNVSPSAKELTKALNERLVGKMKVVDMTPVVEAKKVSAASLAKATKSGVGILLMEGGEASKALVQQCTGRNAIASCGALMIKLDGNLVVLPVAKHNTLPVAVRKICNALGAPSTCPICLEVMDYKNMVKKCAIHIPCGHGIHKECLQNLVKSSRNVTINKWGVKADLFSCPECRTDFAMSADGTTWGSQPAF